MRRDNAFFFTPIVKRIGATEFIGTKCGEFFSASTGIKLAWSYFKKYETSYMKN